MISLLPGIRVAAAPHFHLARTWADRLQLNSGVLMEGNCVMPRDDWRQPSSHEIELLTVLGSDAANTIALFNVPERLRVLWWDTAADPAAAPAAFKAFSAQVLEFLQFKMLPLPPACNFELVIHAPDQASTRPQAGGLIGELSSNRLVGAINLSDETTAVIFLNLGIAQLSNWSLPVSGSGSIQDRARAFLSANPGYPLVKLNLGPAEGYWLPASPVVIDCDTRGRSEVDVQLVLRAGST
jgi:hypothetical protein